MKQRVASKEAAQARRWALRLTARVQKVLAAHAAGLTEVIVPERNKADLDDVPAEVRDQMQFHIVATVDQVLALALQPTELAMAA